MNNRRQVHIHITYQVISIYSYLKETPKHDPLLLAGNGYLHLFPPTSRLLALRPGLRVRPPSSETKRDSCDNVPYHVFMFIIAVSYYLYEKCVTYHYHCQLDFASCCTISCHLISLSQENFIISQNLYKSDMNLCKSQMNLFSPGYQFCIEILKKMWVYPKIMV